MLTTHYSQLTSMCPAAEYLLLLRALLQQMNVPHQIVTGELLNPLYQSTSDMTQDCCPPRLHLLMFGLEAQLMPDI